MLLWDYSSSLSSLTVDCILDINACVEAWSAVSTVGACSTIDDEVITSTAKHFVITRPALEDVIISTAIEEVVTLATI
jgi:hypothetical protein